MDKITKLISLFFVLCIVVLVVTHATGFSKSAGATFSGINSLGTTLTGANIKAGE
jgi:hypothetical protein